ncbi:MAG TPA: hypothetical protein DCZ91_08950, partial [Lachnospiraceae bacterium]|nr:hypothetical protein [Lachnospiraceae bacterium]
ICRHFLILAGEFRRKFRQAQLSEICDVDSENIYGDKFTIEKDAVTGIGNNVMLDFGEFAFGTNGPAVLVICGKSALPVNSINAIFNRRRGKTYHCGVCRCRGICGETLSH